MAEKDLYKVLGVSKNADDKTIKSAYRKLAKKYHPDTNQGNKEAEKKFQDIGEAYQILSDPKKRKLYDEFGMAAFDGSMGPDPEKYAEEMRKYKNSGFGGGNPFGSGNPFGGGSPFGSGSPFGNHGNGSEYTDENGNYYREYHFTDGDGNPFGGDSSPFGGNADDWINNLFGKGFGEYDSYGERAGHNLHSEITISFEEAAFGCEKRLSFDNNPGNITQVHIPAGINEGQTVRLKGKGMPADGWGSGSYQNGGHQTGNSSGHGAGRAGDLLIKVHILEKPGFTRDGQDVYTTANIPFTTAVLGGEAQFMTIHGPVKCKIPAGTQSGSKIRLRGKGIVSMKDPTAYGDEYVTVQIQVPKTISEEEKKVLEKLRKIEAA